MTIIHVPVPMTLTAQDRCDACQTAQAHVATKIHGTTLISCGHCYAKYEDALVLDGAEVVYDSRGTLITSPVASY